jgi:hypothetical protein
VINLVFLVSTSAVKEKTFDALYVQQLVRLIQHANLQDEQIEFFNETDYYLTDRDQSRLSCEHERGERKEEPT